MEDQFFQVGVKTFKNWLLFRKLNRWKTLLQKEHAIFVVVVEKLIIFG